MSAPAAAPRNRNAAVLDAAAELFATKGFRETTMRDIARAAGMLHGSIYYHYGSKEDLLLAVYSAGVESFVAAFAALAEIRDPWERLRRGLALHIAAITRDDPYTRVVNRVRPDQVARHAAALTGLRDRYEDCFRALIDALPLAPGVDRRLLRLMILGAGNHAQLWYRAGGPQTAEEIGRAFADYLIRPIAAGGQA